MATDLDAFGASEEIKETYQKRKKSDVFDVLPENWQTVLLFLNVQTQWRFGPSGVIGLDYLVIEMVCRTQKQTLTEELLQNLQVMELSALAELNRVKD